MNRKITGLVLFGAVLLTATACETEDTADAKPSEAASSAASSPTTEASATAENPSPIPSPNAAQTATLIAELGAIDPGLVVKESRAVSRARSTCQTIQSGMEEVKVQNMAELRFEGGNVPNLTSDEAAQIVQIVKDTFCK